MQTVVETPDFIGDAKAAGLSETEREAVVRYVSAHPDAGDIPRHRGARKIRFAGQR